MPPPTLEPTTDTTPSTTPSAPVAWWDRWFEVAARGSRPRIELRAGVVTFLTMAYILFLNPAILGAVADVHKHSLPFGQVLTVTALVAGAFTLALGILGRLPFAGAAGLGLNGFVAFNLVAQHHLGWPDAMGIIVVEGLVIAVLVLVGFREAVIRAIPHDLRLAIGMGIGVFIALIGLVNAHIVVKGDAVPVALGQNLANWKTLVFVVGLMGTGALTALRVRGALLIGILGSTVLATVINAISGRTLWTDGSAVIPHSLVAPPDFGLVGQFSVTHFWSVLGFGSAVAVVIAVGLSDFFDTTGTGIAIGKRAGLLDDQGRLPRMKTFLFIDALGAAAGGMASASSNTTYIESSAGVEDGGRTGITSVVTGALFLLCLFISPLAGMVPTEATAPILVIVGVLMFDLFYELERTRDTDRYMALPIFLTVLTMGWTYSITNGVGCGFVSYSFMALLTRSDVPVLERVHPLMLLFAGIFIWYFVHGTV
jgi:adenine/guanine/hypoxanthine permease